jgi:hypothetical protein
MPLQSRNISERQKNRLTVNDVTIRTSNSMHINSDIIRYEFKHSSIGAIARNQCSDSTLSRFPTFNTRQETHCIFMMINIFVSDIAFSHRKFHGEITLQTCNPPICSENGRGNSCSTVCAVNRIPSCCHFFP